MCLHTLMESFYMTQFKLSIFKRLRSKGRMGLLSRGKHSIGKIINKAARISGFKQTTVEPKIDREAYHAFIVLLLLPDIMLHNSTNNFLLGQ
ncbi:hypothetical protein ACJX0J_009275, partial [Zea mays]